MVPILGAVEEKPIQHPDWRAPGALDEAPKDAPAQVDGPGDASAKLLREIADRCAAKQTGIRVRTSLTVFDPESQTYKSWPDQNWRLDARDLDEAQKFRQAVELLFDLFTLKGIEKTAGALQEAKQVALLLG